MWTNENRARYDRNLLRYPSDLTDAEWAHVAPLIPPAKRGGNRRHVDERDVVNGLMYVLSTGCQWRAVPKDLPPRSTLYDYFDRWSWDGTLDRIHDALYVKCREAAAREASPTAAIIDSQSVKSAEKGGLASIRRAMTPARRSWAKAPHPRRHAGPVDACDRPRRRHPGSRRRRGADGDLVRRLSVPDQLFADGGYRGPQFQAAIGRTLARVRSRSSSGRIRPRPSSSCPSAGSSNALSPGSAAAADWPRIGNASTARRSPSSASPPSASCCENYGITHNVSGQTLSAERVPSPYSHGSQIVVHL